MLGPVKVKNMIKLPTSLIHKMLFSGKEIHRLCSCGADGTLINGTEICFVCFSGVSFREWAREESVWH